jgi:hypothetical protein
MDGLDSPHRVGERALRYSHWTRPAGPAGCAARGCPQGLFAWPVRVQLPAWAASRLVGGETAAQKRREKGCQMARGGTDHIGTLATKLKFLARLRCVGETLTRFGAIAMSAG